MSFVVFMGAFAYYKLIDADFENAIITMLIGIYLINLSIIIYLDEKNLNL